MQENSYQNYIETADWNIQHARTVIDSQPILFDAVCHYCFKAVELYLKAFLIFKSIEFSEDADIHSLLQNCQDELDSFFLVKIKNLKEFAKRGVIPGSSPIPQEAEANDFYQIAIAVKMVILNELPG